MKIKSPKLALIVTVTKLMFIKLMFLKTINNESKILIFYQSMGGLSGDRCVTVLTKFLRFVQLSSHGYSIKLRPGS